MHGMVILQYFQYNTVLFLRKATPPPIRHWDSLASILLLNGNCFYSKDEKVTVGLDKIFSTNTTGNSAHRSHQGLKSLFFQEYCFLCGAAACTSIRCCNSLSFGEWNLLKLKNYKNMTLSKKSGPHNVVVHTGTITTGFAFFYFCK